MTTLTSYPTTGPRKFKMTRHFRNLRRDCRARLVAVHGEENNWSIASLRDMLSASRRKPIHLVPMAIPDYSPSGMWVSTSVAEFVIYEARTTKAHQEHIIAHELAHILCGHEAVAHTDDILLSQLFPDISPEIVRRALQRMVYSDRKEQEAEMTASLLLAPAWQLMEPTPPEYPQDGVISRLRAAIGEEQAAHVGTVG